MQRGYSWFSFLILTTSVHRLLTSHLSIDTGFPGGAVGKESIYQCRRHWRVGLIPGSGRSLISWRRKWQSIPVYCLENPKDRGAWRATVHGVTKSQTRPITCVRVHRCAHTQLMCLHLSLPFYYLVHVSHILFLMSFSCSPFLFKCLVFHFICCLLNFFAASFSDCLRDEDIHTYIFSLLTIFSTSSGVY